MKKETSTLKKIDQQFWYGSQDANASSFFEMGGQRFKTEIKSDSYDTQSFARIYIWAADRKEWSLVYSIPGQLMQTKRDLIYGTPRQTLSAVDFYRDAQTLIVNAKKIVF